MKILPCLLLLSLVCPILADDEPFELTNLRKAWAKSVAEDVNKKNKIYLKELEKLQKKFTGANKLTSANAINDEMQMVRAMNPQEHLISPPHGKWNVVYSTKETRTYSIKGHKITILSSSCGGVGQTVDLTRYAQGWLAKFPDPNVTEYIFLIDDKIYIHHWGSSGVNFQNVVPYCVGMGIRL